MRHFQTYLVLALIVTAGLMFTASPSAMAKTAKSGHKHHHKHAEKAK